MRAFSPGGDGQLHCRVTDVIGHWNHFVSRLVRCESPYFAGHCDRELVSLGGYSRISSRQSRQECSAATPFTCTSEFEVRCGHVDIHTNSSTTITLFQRVYLDAVNFDGLLERDL